MSDWLLLDWLDLPFNTKVVLEGVAFLSASAGVIGCFAVLRGRALTGDALSHAALPGLCAAFLVVGDRSFSAMLLGALVTGLAGVVVIALVRRYTRIKEDAAIGIVLSVFFGAGIVLSSIIQRYGEGSKAGLESFILGKTAGMIPDDLQLIRLLTLSSLVLVVLLFKEFKLVSFDTGFARVQGWPTLFLDLLLMVLIAVAVVIGLPAVGVMMMAALLILPAAAARFWTENLAIMLVLSALFGVAAGVAGTLISAYFHNWPTGPTIILAAAVLFLGSVLFAPRRGGLARWLAQRRFESELQERQLLQTLYDLVEPRLPNPVPLAVEEIQNKRSWSASQARRLLSAAARHGDLQIEGGYVTLTDAGRRAAAAAARSQRLWQTALRENPELAIAFSSFDAVIDDVLPAEVVRDAARRLQAEGRLPSFEAPAGEGVP